MLPSERSKPYTISRSPCSKRSSYPSPNEDEALVSMRAASLKNIDRMMADGSHYDSHRELPSVVGVDATIRLEGSDSDLEEALAREAGEGGYDVVLDYLWGRPTEALVAALTGHDVTAESSRTRLVQIGEMAGPVIRLPAAALRSSGLEVMGSGGCSIPPTAIFETFPRLWDLAGKGELRIDAETVPLPDVEQAWQRQDLGGRRLVLVL